MASVWRIEWDASHKGVYASINHEWANSAMTLAGDKNDDPPHRPRPSDDFRGDDWLKLECLPHDNRRYGFRSGRELVKWFDRNSRKKLAMVEHGGERLVLARYECELVVYGGRQVVFDVTKAIRKEWRYL